jgi:putative membrane protein
MAPDQPACGPANPAVDPTRRTYLAEERTLLAWWRTALAVVAVGLGVGKIVPQVAHVSDGPYIAVGACYGLLALGIVVFAAQRDRSVVAALRRGAYEQLPRWAVWLFSAALAALVAASTVLICLHP